MKKIIYQYEERFQISYHECQWLVNETFLGLGNIQNHKV